MSNEYAENQKRQAERRRQLEQAEERAFADRMAAQEAARLGLPSPRMRAAAAGPLVFRDGPIINEMRAIRTGHYVPRNQSHHKLDAACWCGPKERPRDADGGRVWDHDALMPFERRMEGGSPGDQRATLEGLARERGEKLGQ